VLVLVISNFITDIDHRWASRVAEKIRLRIIGSAALMLQTEYARGTKDSDVLQTDQLLGDNKIHLEKLAGKGSELHRRHKLYIDIVASGLPFLPRVPIWHAIPELNQSLLNFHIESLDVVDVVVSKLKRFSPSDESDIDAMVSLGAVPHETLLARFKAAVDNFEMDARAENIPSYIENLHRVERDILGVPETELDLPDWV
jgi:hypothetical protein